MLVVPVRKVRPENFPIPSLVTLKELQIMNDVTTAPVVVNTDPFTQITEFKYRFNKDDLGNKRDPVTLNVKTPSLQGVVRILEDGSEKEQQLLLEALADVIDVQVKAWVGDNADASQATFDKAAAQFNFTAVAHMEKKDRRSSGIAKEVWEAFAKKYQEIMPGITGKSVDAIKNATIVFLKKFSIIKTDKVTIKKLLPQLALFVEHADKESLEQFSEIIDTLNTKAEEYIKSDEIKTLVDNLGLDD